MLYRNNVQEIKTVEDHDGFIENNDKCIMFFGSNRCSKCGDMTAIYNDMARNYPQIKFSHVEVTKTTVEDLGDSLPVFVCYKNNTPVGKVIGADKNGIVNMINNNFKINNVNNVNNVIKLTEINDINTYNKFISTNNKCIMFFGSQSCHNCRDIQPKIEQMIYQYPNVKFAHIELTKTTINIIPKQYQNQGIPLFVCYKNSRITDNVLGANEEAIIVMIDNQLM
jgi:thioredoxin-like negative regulator of GroEL